MKVVTFSISSIEEFNERARRAFKGEKQGSHRTFLSLELMHRILTPNRWGILRALLGGKETGIRELARQLDRDVKDVHTDVTALAKAGVIDRANDGKVVFPYDAIHVNFTIRKDAAVRDAA